MLEVEGRFGTVGIICKSTSSVLEEPSTFHEGHEPFSSLMEGPE
jgi:hypothetical protein